MSSIASPTRGRPPLTDDAQVIAAGEKLEADGIRVSGYMLRTRLGGHGRGDRLMEVWQRHVDHRATQEADAAPPPVAPPTLPAEMRSTLDAARETVGASLEQLAAALFFHATESAAQRVADADKRAAEAEAARQASESAGEQAMDQLDAEIQGLTEQAQLASERAEQAEHAAQQAEGVAKDRGEALEAAQKESREALAEIARLRANLAAAEDAMHNATKEREHLRQQMAVEMAGHQAAKALAEERARALEAADRRADQAHQRAESAQQRADAESAKADAERQRAREAVKAQHSEEEKVNALTRDLNRLTEDLKTQRVHLEQAHSELAKLKGKTP